MHWTRESYTHITQTNTHTHTQHLRRLLEHEICDLLIGDQRAKAEIEHDLLALLNQFANALKDVRERETQRLDVDVRGQL
jgi:hypothetical protein